MQYVYFANQDKVKLLSAYNSKIHIIIVKYIKDDRGYSQIFDLENKSNEMRLRHRADMMIAEVSDPASKKLMEIGAGTGDIAYWIAEQIPVNVLATDLCIPFVDKARSKYFLNVRRKL